MALANLNPSPGRQPQRAFPFGTISIPHLPLTVWALIIWGCFITLQIIGALLLVIPRNRFGPIVLLCAIFAVYEIFRLRVRIGNLIMRDWPLFLMMFVIAISVTWALDPRLSLQRTVVIWSVFILTIYGSIVFKREAFLKLIDVALSFAVVVSIMLALFVPSVGQSGLIAHHGGSWSGMFSHREYFVEVCGAAILVWMYKWAAEPKTAWFQAVRIAIALGAAYLGDSKTSLLAMLIGMAAFAFVWGLMNITFNGQKLARRTAQMLFLLAVIIVPPAMISIAPMVPQLVGREDNLSGRTRIWRWAFYFIQERPLTGFGYRSFWGGSDVNKVIAQDRAYSYEQSANSYDSLENGHNGYYDTYFELGWFGLIALGVLTISGVWRTVTLIGRPRGDPIAPFSLAVLTFLYVDNIAETVFFRPDSVPWPLFCCAFFLAGKALEQKP